MASIHTKMRPSFDGLLLSLSLRRKFGNIASLTCPAERRQLQMV